MQRLIPAYKDQGSWHLSTYLAELLASAIFASQCESAILVPVPSVPAAVRCRGFDHTKTLVRRVARLTGLEVAHRSLLLRAGGRDQVGLTRNEREENLVGKFKSAAGNRRVVVCDDILTTGSTLRQASRALTLAGHRVVAAVVIAETPLRMSAVG